MAVEAFDSSTRIGTAEAEQAQAPKAITEHGRLRGALREAWSARELLYFLTWRDVKVRYKQTALGVLWAVIQPLFTMALFTVLFGRVAHISSGGVPRPIFYFSALLPWLYISTTVTQGSMSLVSNSQLITKIYFPRIMLPAATSLGGLVDFLIGSVLLVGFLAYYHIQPSWALLLWPLLVVQMVMLGLAIAMFLAALNVKFRDVKYAVPFAIQLWLFASPVIYPASLLPKKLQFVAALNPATGLIEGFRHALVPSAELHWNLLWFSLATTVVLFVVAGLFFARTERAFADVI